MVVTDPEATLLTACENGYGKRTPFGIGAASEDDAEEENVSAARYRTQHRGGKGLRDIKTTERNGRVIGIIRVADDDEVLMMTARGKIQRVAAREIGVIGRNTQGVRIMTLDDDDVLAAIVRVPQEDVSEEAIAAELSSVPPTLSATSIDRPPTAELDYDDDADESDEVADGEADGEDTEDNVDESPE